MRPASGCWARGVPLKDAIRTQQPDAARASAGQTLRGRHGEELPGGHLVAASAHQTRVVLAQAETVGTGPELAGGGAGGHAVLAALPERRRAGRVVTGAALVATRAVGRQMVRKGGPRSSS